MEIRRGGVSSPEGSAAGVPYRLSPEFGRTAPLRRGRLGVPEQQLKIGQVLNLRQNGLSPRSISTKIGGTVSHVTVRTILANAGAGQQVGAGEASDKSIGKGLRFLSATSSLGRRTSAQLGRVAASSRSMVRAGRVGWLRRGSSSTASPAAGAGCTGRSWSASHRPLPSRLAASYPPDPRQHGCATSRR
jgi:hypothetical protein